MSRDEISKFLSFVLRHEPQAIGLQLDSEGWADIDALIEGAARSGRSLDIETIQDVVASSDKKRFSLSTDGRRIRAAQGHSTAQVQLQHVQKQPPERLYHGTASRFLESIEAQGLVAGARHHVHLSQDVPTALQVGQRYGSPVILEVDAAHARAGVRILPGRQWRVADASRARRVSRADLGKTIVERAIRATLPNDRPKQIRGARCACGTPGDAQG